MLERKFYVKKEIFSESTFSNKFYILLYTFKCLFNFLERDKFVLAILIRISEWEL